MPVEKQNEKTIEARKMAKMFVGRLKSLEDRAETLNRSIDTVAEVTSKEIDDLRLQTNVLFALAAILTAGIVLIVLKLSGVF